MAVKERGGAVRLLLNGDLTPGRKNHFGHPLIGWRSASLGEGGLVNPRGFAALRVVLQKIVTGGLVDLYDQPILVENAGAIVLCRVGDRVGLVQNYRMVGERIGVADPKYVATLDEQRRWEELLATLGAWKWELPRGIPPTDIQVAGSPTASDAVAQLVKTTAKLEACEEGGYQIENARLVGRVNTNPTFFAHAQYVVVGDVVSTTQSRPEDLEIIGNTRLFAAADIRRMVDSGELDDGLTLAALAIAGFHF